MKLHRLVSSLVAALGLAVVACGGGGNPNYRVPVDSPLLTFQPPEESELTGESAEDIDLTKPQEEPPPEAQPEPPPPPAPTAKGDTKPK